jgi:hypothetical protein
MLRIKLYIPFIGCESFNIERYYVIWNKTHHASFIRAQMTTWAAITRLRDILF